MQSWAFVLVLLLASSADAFLLASRPALLFSRRTVVFMSEDPLEVARAALRLAEEAEASALAELARLTSPEEAAAVVSTASRTAAVTNSTQSTGEELVKNPVVVAAGVALLALLLQGPPAPPSPVTHAVTRKVAQVSTQVKGSTQAMSPGDVVRKQTAEKQAKAATVKAATAKAAKQKDADMAGVRREGAQDGKRAANAARARARAKSAAKAKAVTQKSTAGDKRIFGRRQEEGGLSPTLALGGAGLLGLVGFALTEAEEDTSDDSEAVGSNGEKEPTLEKEPAPAAVEGEKVAADV